MKIINFLLLFSILLNAQSKQNNNNASKPNILWIVAEDHGPHMGCYGDAFATTPHIDKFAEKGMCFNYAWSSAPVCAAARTTLWSGISGPSSGGEHMRSMSKYPEGKNMFPKYLRDIGYYCAGNGKEDYNLTTPEGVWDESSIKAHYNKRKPGQPFFAYFNNTQSHEGHIHDITRKAKSKRTKSLHDPSKVKLPKYHPDCEAMRLEWAAYYNSVTKVDAAAGKRLAELAEAGLEDNTIVFYFADHGAGFARQKRWPNNAGLQVPVVVYFPEKWKHLAPKEYKAGGRSDRLISFVDFAPTVLSIAGIEAPKWMQGYAFAGKHQTKEQPYVYGFRGRMDERLDLVRSVSNGRYVYLRNYMPQFSQGQRVNSQIRFPFSSTAAWKKLYDEGKLNKAQSLFWETPKAPEELYDLKNDPDEINNLANSKEHQRILKKMREAQQTYARDIRDVGFIPENERFTNTVAPYDFGHDPKLYPFDRIISTAEMASLMKPEDISNLTHLMSDENKIVRYWATMGIMMHGEKAVEQSKKELEKALTDTSDDVKIAAAWALVKYTSSKYSKDALQLLSEQALRKDNIFVVIAALTALDDCELKTKSLQNDFAKWEINPDTPNKRYASYPGKLMTSIFLRYGIPVKKGKRK
ncbi:sulfatase-like hydrolase/transferase [Flavicella sediminum]|uniref:sulfatase-like hydrolase/transferase n=1 Tax=Flavicella sediminum TaxID=2585141 RepID=UPI00112019F2|nr:sulfatase-like hydrolase/transferase [Flavicella sediminum]